MPIDIQFYSLWGKEREYKIRNTEISFNKAIAPFEGL